PATNRLDGVVPVAVAGHHDDSRVRRFFENLRDGGETFAGTGRIRWQTEILQYHCGLPLPDHGQRLRSIGCRDDVVTIETTAQLATQPDIVLDHQQPTRPRTHDAALILSVAEAATTGSANGNRIVNEVPLPMALTTSSDPPNTRTYSRA